MFLHIDKASFVKDHTLWLEFNNGEKGQLNFKPLLEGEVFDPLKEDQFFRNFTSDGITVCWPNGADFAPEYLYEKLREQSST